MGLSLVGGQTAPRHGRGRAAARKEDFVAAAAAVDPVEATELAANSWRLWMVARDIPGGRAFLASVLDERPADRSRWRALALYGDGLFAFWRGEREESRRRNVDDGDHERALELATSARAHAAGLGEAMGQAPLHSHAQATRLAGDYEEAARLFEESLALNRRIDDQSMVTVELHNLGHVEIHRGNADAAEQQFSQIPHSDDPYSEGMTRLNEAALAFRRDEHDRAHSLLDRAEAIFRDNGIEAAADDRFELDWLREQLACAAS